MLVSACEGCTAVWRKGVKKRDAWLMRARWESVSWCKNRGESWVTYKKPRRESGNVTKRGCLSYRGWIVNIIWYKALLDEGSVAVVIYLLCGSWWAGYQLF